MRYLFIRLLMKQKACVLERNQLFRSAADADFALSSRKTLPFATGRRAGTVRVCVALCYIYISATPLTKGHMMCHSARAVIIGLLMPLFCPEFCLFAAETTTEKLVADGIPLKLRRQVLLGIEHPLDGCFAVRSATPGSVDEFGGHYLSIAMLADVILAPGDFQISLKMGLVKLSEQPETLMLNVKIGAHWYEFAFEDRQLTVKGVQLDAVRRDDMEISHATTVSLDGRPFTLDFLRDGGMVSLRLNGRLLHSFWTEPAGGDLAICVERKTLLRVATSTDDMNAEVRIYDWTATAQFEQTTAARQRWEEQTGDSWRLMKRIGNAYEYQPDDLKRPNVLLIGDSISIYYTDTVRRLLTSRADVFRTPMGPGKAETLFESLNEFLEQGKWDVIHFNSGLHDFARKEGTDDDLQNYRKNLKIIVGKLRGTGARLIWASTTPVPKKAPAAATSDSLCRRYNATARVLMNEESIPINDLYNAVLPEHPRYWTAPNNIHFNVIGSAFIGRRVANAISPFLAAENLQ